MKSSMTLIQSNGWTEIDLLLKQIWRRLIWWQVSFNIKSRKYFNTQITHFASGLSMVEPTVLVGNCTSIWSICNRWTDRRMSPRGGFYSWYRCPNHCPRGTLWLLQQHHQAYHRVPIGSPAPRLVPLCLLIWGRQNSKLIACNSLTFVVSDQRYGPRPGWKFVLWLGVYIVGQQPHWKGHEQGLIAHEADYLTKNIHVEGLSENAQKWN